MKITSTVYRLLLSDGQKIPIESSSAGAAIEEGLRKFRGRKVVQCYSGLTEEDCAAIRLVDRDRKPMPGIIEHDVPEHEAIPEGATFPSTRRKDETLPMFNDAEITAESERAKNRGAQPMPEPLPRARNREKNLSHATP